MPCGDGGRSPGGPGRGARAAAGLLPRECWGGAGGREASLQGGAGGGQQRRAGGERVRPGVTRGEEGAGVGRPAPGRRRPGRGAAPPPLPAEPALPGRAAAGALPVWPGPRRGKWEPGAAPGRPEGDMGPPAAPPARRLLLAVCWLVVAAGRAAGRSGTGRGGLPRTGRAAGAFGRQSQRNAFVLR